MKKKNIVFITADITLRGGIERVVANTANYLATKKIPAIIISVFRSHSGPFYTISEGVKIIYLSSFPFSRISNWLISPYLILVNRILINMLSPGSLMVMIPPYLIFIRAFWAISPSLVVYSEHMSFSAAGPLFKLFRRKCLSRLKNVHVLNKTSELQYTQLGICSLVIPNAVTIFDHQEQFKFRPISDLPKPTPLNVLSVGRLEAEKGFSDIVRISSHMHNYEGIFFTIVGDGKEKKMLVKMAKSLKLKNLEFKPATRNIEDVYVDHICLLITSRSETFPMVMLEAMSFGLIPICYDDLDGPRDIVTNGVDGFFVGRGDLSAILKILLKLNNDRVLTHELSCAAIVKAKKYSQDIINPRMLSLLT